ncbi:MAG: hypothetical protein QG657_2661, partial [Acidobacteriota bacterium]|nr:hypothetical protein [Acidobacteriota bacterium]
SPLGKNAPGWGKRIQLGILNLNQIGCRTGETLFSGWERVLSGEENLRGGKRDMREKLSLL